MRDKLGRRHCTANFVPFVAFLFATFGAPSAAIASVDVIAVADGTVWIRGEDAAEQVVVDRDDEGRLRIAVLGSSASSSDASCEVDTQSAAAICPAASTGVRALLGGGDDSLDARDASLALLVVNGGDGSDVLRPSGARFARVWDSTTTDTVDLSDLEAAVRARWNARHRRVALTCPECGESRTVLLAGRPGTVVLTDHRDEVELAGWTVPGSTTWRLGGDNDRFAGAPRRSSIVEGGDGSDQLVSEAARDQLLGGADADKLVDFGGRGDVLLGGAGIDALSSMDGQRDTLDGQGDRDFCLAPDGRTPSHCDRGTVRGMEDVRYLPMTSRAWVTRMLGLR